MIISPEIRSRAVEILQLCATDPHYHNDAYRAGAKLFGSYYKPDTTTYTDEVMLALGAWAFTFDPAYREGQAETKAISLVLGGWTPDRWIRALSFGPAVDDAPAVQIEIRAAYLASIPKWWDDEQYESESYGALQWHNGGTPGDDNDGGSSAKADDETAGYLACVIAATNEDSHG